MLDDAQLLQRYADEKSEAALAELVRRHLDLVYSTALRQVDGDAHRAKDIAQQVFILLARKANSLTRHPVLTGWLYLTAQHCAARAMRGEWRRRAREREAAAMSESAMVSVFEWERARPVLDAAMLELGGADREAVLLRYFAHRPFAQIGAALQLSEDGARRRVERALEKLRVLLARRGVTSSAAVLAAVLEGQAVLAAPAALAVSVTGAALHAHAVGGGGSAFFMSITKPQIALSTAVVLGIGAFIYRMNANIELRREVTAARRDGQIGAKQTTENQKGTPHSASTEAMPREETLARGREESGSTTPQMAKKDEAPRVDNPPAAPAATARNLVGLNLPNAEVHLVLRTYQSISGQTITRDPALDRMRRPIMIPAGQWPKDEALELMRRALYESARIMLEPAADGTLHARVVP